MKGVVLLALGAYMLLQLQVIRAAAPEEIDFVGSAVLAAFTAFACLLAATGLRAMIKEARA